jgi:hypothetical protein
VRSRRVGVAAAVALLFFGILALYLSTVSADLLQNGDTRVRYWTTQSIVDAHHVWIANPQSIDARLSPGVGGHLYGYYAPGQSLLMIPFYIAGKVAAHHLSLPYDVATQYAARSLDAVLGAALAVMLFLTALTLGYSRRVAGVLAVLLAVATPAWPDAQSGLDQTQVDLLLLIAAYAGLRSSRPGARTSLWTAVSACAAGMLVLTRYDSLLYIPIVALYPSLVAYVRRGFGPAIRLLIVFAATLAPWGGAVLWWNWVRFGSVVKTGLAERTFGEPVMSGLAGLLVSPGKGLLWYMPLVFALPVVARSFARRDRAFAALSAALVLAPLLFYANVLYWHGDPAWGPRYLYVALPYLVLPLGEILSAWGHIRVSSRVVFALLALAGVALSVSAVSVSQWRFWYRLQAHQESSVLPAAWSGRPFHWGSQDYTYYWTPRWSPIVVQADDVYQVIRLDVLGDEQFRYTEQPDPYVGSNPAELYPINTLNFWWADVMHPLFRLRVRLLLLGLLLAIGAISAGGLAYSLRDDDRSTTAGRVPMTRLPGSGPVPREASQP